MVLRNQHRQAHSTFCAPILTTANPLSQGKALSYRCWRGYLCNITV